MNAAWKKIEEQVKAAGATTTLLEGFSKIPEASLVIYIHSIDDSSFSFSQWIEALNYFEQWLPKDADFSVQEQIEYLVCAAEGAISTANLLPLKDVLANYLKMEGVEKLGL